MKSSVRICLPLLLFASVSSTAQEPWLQAPFSAKPAEMLSAAANVSVKDADAIVLLEDNVIRFDSEGKATHISRMVFKILTPQGAEDWASVSVRYEPWREQKPEIKARVMTADGAVHMLDPATLSDAPTRDGSVVYSDDRVLRGPLPAVAPGAVVEKEISVTETKSMLSLGQIYRVIFGARVPVLHSRFTLDTPASMVVRHSVALLPGLVPDRKEADGRVGLTFEQGRMEALEPSETFAPGDVQRWPHIAVATGSSWQNMAREYSRIVDEKVKDADVKTFVDRAKKEGKDREAVIESLVRQLHEHIRYTGVEFGESSIIPQPPGETLKRKYGDCKDKSALLVAMLRAAGIPAHLALLSTGPGPDSPAELPGLGVFDHAIVYAPGPPEHWIDATAEFSHVPDFPAADQGRLALIVRPESDKLVMTPELPSSANKIVETRNVFFAEKGPARFLETTEVYGLAEAGYRSYYQGGDPKERRKGVESYIKNEYASEKLGKFETSDARDFSKPFTMTIEASEARRAYTSRSDAALYVQIHGILGRLPEELTSDPGEENNQEDKPLSERAKKKRKHDFVFWAPSVTEWRYRVTPPVGFVVREVPAKETYRFGPATLNTEFSPDLQNGVLSGVFRFDSGKRRWSVSEVEEFRTALKQWQQTSNPHIAFSLKGQMLLEAGRIKEGISELKALSAGHPKESLHHIQIAYALLDAGLGESARQEAKLATQLEPTSADAYRALGWILGHDLVSRRLKRGFDLEGALAAYRKALELEPKNNEIRGDYAILLESDSDGIRYGKTAKLEEALAQYTTIGDKLEEYQLTDNPLYLRLYMGRHKDLIAEVRKLTKTDARTALLIASLAATEGPAAAVAEGNKLQSQGGTRSQVLGNAAQHLVNIRRYQEAADLLTASLEGSGAAASVAARAALLKNVHVFDGGKLDLNDAGNVVRSVLALFMQEGEVTDEMLESFSCPYASPTDPKIKKRKLRKDRESVLQARSSLRGSGTALEIVRDMVMTLAQVNSEYDGVNTYRIRYSTPGVPMGTMFVSRQEGKLRVTGFSGEFSGVGHEVLQRLKAGGAESSRKLLDWVREEVKVGGGEDPLAGPVFPRLWTRGQQGSAADVRLAAAVLASTGDRPEVAIPFLLEAQATPPSDAVRPYIDLALAQAYAKGGRFADLLAVTERLRAAFPDSLIAFQVRAVGLQALGQHDEWERLVNERLKRFPDDVDAIRSLANLSFVRGDVRKSISELARLVEIGKAEVQDYNNLSWKELFDRNVTQKGLEYGQQGNLLSKNSVAELLHTVAAVYAEIGKISEAREMILKAMDQWGLEEPNETCWYIFGRIAEQYGMTDAAIAAYRRVERPDFDWQIPGSTYQLAARQLAALQGPAKAATATKPR